jgi:hypothetical protein
MTVSSGGVAKWFIESGSGTGSRVKTPATDGDVIGQQVSSLGQGFRREENGEDVHTLGAHDLFY